MIRKAEIGDCLISRDKYFRYNKMFKISKIKHSSTYTLYYCYDEKYNCAIWFQLESPYDDYYAVKISLDRKDYQ